MTTFISADAMGPHCIRMNFDGPVLNDAALRDVASYFVGGMSILSVQLPAAQNQPYSGGGPPADGGSPEFVYLIMQYECYTIAPTQWCQVIGAVQDWAFAPVVNAPRLVTYYPRDTFSYLTDDGLRTKQAFMEFSKVGKAAFNPVKNPENYANIMAIGKISDLASGGHITKLMTAMDGPDTTYYGTGFLPGGYATPLPAPPNLGDTITLEGIPYHVDRLWGPCNGSNTMFRTTQAYNPYSCEVLMVPGPAEGAREGFLDRTDWFSPDIGHNRLLRLVEAPPSGAAVYAIYKPRRSLIRIGSEFFCYDNADPIANTVDVVSRGDLCTPVAEHAIGDTVEDMWATSDIGRARFNTLAFGASGKALESIGRDVGSPRSDNPSLTDTQLRRYIFNTSVTMRATPETARMAIRYMYPKLWPYIQVVEDPRWPGHLTIWYSNLEPIGDSWPTGPSVEPWETWLDHLAYLDGYPMDTINETYYRDPITDVSYDGDYFLADWTEDPELWPHPVIVSGPDIYLIGTPAGFIPPPSTVSSDYLKYVIRPPTLDKVLPVGTGILLLEAP